MTQLAAIQLRDAFRAERAAAGSLGFHLQAAFDDGLALCRLHPVTDRARALCRENNAGAIDATQAFDGPADALEALKLAIDAALDMARQAYV